MRRKNRTKRLIWWISENIEDWYTICGMGRDQITEEEFMRLWNELNNNRFYDLTWVLLTCHYCAVQNRIAKNLEYIADKLRDEMRKRGIDPEHPSR